MRGYDLLRQYQMLSAQQREQCVQYFLGGVSMIADGFRDKHPQTDNARFALDNFEQAIKYASNKLLPVLEAYNVNVVDCIMLNGFAVEALETIPTARPCTIVDRCDFVLL